MTERRQPDADPDATVMQPAGGSNPPDSDATVMIPAARPDDDATVMIPTARPDDDATIMIPAPRAEDDATVVMPMPSDEDATVMIPAAAGDPDATVALSSKAFTEPDPEATVAIPTPGRRRDPRVAPPLAPVPAATVNAPTPGIGELGGLNPLVAAANPILAVAAQIRQTLRHDDPEGLLGDLSNRVAAFEAAAREAGCADDAVACAGTALCALVDESAASTPWGSGWSVDGLLSLRQADTAVPWDFFEILEQKSGDPETHRHLLEFFYVCMALGFEGRFRHQADGRQALHELRGKLLDRLRPLQSPRDGDLAGRWRGVSVPARRPAGALGLWAASAVAALLLGALYLGFQVSLGGLSDPVTREIAQLKAPLAATAPQSAAPTAATPHIAAQLAAEIARGEVAVADAAGMSTVVIRSDRLFGSGSARLEPAVEPVMLRVAEALDRVPGSILVTGHTDDVPIRTARFPSNWELSMERASSVVALMAGKLKDPSRLRAEGLADSAPAVANDSAANRARNRRVEIILRSSP